MADTELEIISNQVLEPSIGNLFSFASVLPSPTLQNVVSTVNFGSTLDLKAIACHARNPFSNLVLEPSIDNPLSSESVLPSPTLQNVVSTVNFGCTLDLKAIACHARNVEYNPKRFAAAMMRIREPKTTALIFSSGKIVCTGAKTKQQSLLATRKCARIIQKLGFGITFNDFKIQNIVASCDIGCPLSLLRFVTYHSAFSVYEPELFPGLIYRMKNPKVTILVFPSGKMVLAGARKTIEIFEAFKNIYPVLMSYRINK